MSDCKNRRGRFFCPDKWQIFNVIGGLLPQGRAWQSDDWVFGATSLDELPTIMQRWWAAVAELFAWFSDYACQITHEFFCATANRSLPLWYADYGFPDECDPYEELCEKVRAKGGSTCEYLTEIAEKRGWKIRCWDCQPGEDDPESASDLANADCGVVDCACPPGTIFITIFLDESAAYEDDWYTNTADCAVADLADFCEPNVEQMRCLIQRLKPVGVSVVYDYEFPVL